MKLGEILSEMILYGDIDEAPWPENWKETTEEEAYVRNCIAATILKIMNDGQGGKCSDRDDIVAPFLKQEIIC